MIFLPAIIFDQGYFILSETLILSKFLLQSRSCRDSQWRMGVELVYRLRRQFHSVVFFLSARKPVFWLTIPFPTDWVPYLMGRCSFSIRLRRCNRNRLPQAVCQKRRVRHAGRHLYAFSGFSIYNIFFNHFHEVIVFFPLLLIAMDEWMDHGTRGVLR